MQLGISTYTYGWAVGVPGNRPAQPLDELRLLDQAVRLGVRLVQFGDNWPLHELADEQLAELSRQSVQQGITLEIGARGLTEAHLYRYIALADRLQSRLLRFVLDTVDYEPSVEVIIDLLRNALPDLDGANVTLGIENHDRLLAREFADIVERVGSSRVGICLDSVNSMGAGEGLAEVVRTLAPYTVNLHLKDFGIQRPPHLMGFQIDGRIAGQGMLNIPWLVDQVSQYGRCQTAILEQWVVPESTLADSIRKEAVWAEESLTHLKNSGLFTVDHTS
ncbi:sugar phosphate isomerase/epimerase family protein [Spirosoma oryzicola]|uniref:sugar phosphate isomerase/epimerase family protein n=1 Tax=Spirosoma oryzicola TaxID=2898794 RepID=UPI001E3919CA|nr:TIM barrel protein [Spirosoma oryzicola]UHG93075.1 sugar phosphate isomerase/epimerase [Spirosoma oryzicola]